MSRYVALGSSMAAGLRIRPTAEDPRVTIGGNDVGDVQSLFAAGLPQVACDTGCEVVRVAQASRDHHARSAEPLTTKFGLLCLFKPGHPAPLHPNAAGMRVVADLVVAQAS